MSDTSNGIQPQKCKSILEVGAVQTRAQEMIQWLKQSLTVSQRVQCFCLDKKTTDELFDYSA